VKLLMCVIQSIASQRKHENAIMVAVTNSRRHRCGACGRGIIVDWQRHALAPRIRHCKVCGAKTEVQFVGRMIA
jgi:hypothetical protein